MTMIAMLGREEEGEVTHSREDEGGRGRKEGGKCLKECELADVIGEK